MRFRTPGAVTGASTDMPAIFLHLHRTGGTTLYHLLDHLYGREETYAIDGTDYQASVLRFTQLPKEQRERFRLIKGHQFWGLHRFCRGGAVYFTLLRHPRERAISQYYFHLGLKGRYSIPPGTTLEEFLESGRFISSDNGMTRFIAGKAGDEVPHGRCTKDVLDLAKDHLQRDFAAVGITELFDASLVLFKRTLGWKPYPHYRIRNVNRRKPPARELTSREEGALLFYNRFDHELYRFSRNLFKEQVEKAGPGFADEAAFLAQARAADTAPEDAKEQAS